MRPAYRILFVLTCAIPFTPAVQRTPLDPRCLPDSALDVRQTSSNILPEDYVGPGACIQCHRHKHELWSAHPHSRMNQLPGPESVVGDFAGHTLRLPAGNVTFTSEGGSYRMSVQRGGEHVRSYEVTRTVGSRFAQFYIGVQRDGPEPAGHAVYSEHMLPFAWWMSLGRWLPKPFFDADGPEELKDGIPLVEGIDHVRDIRPYNAVCMNCHNTFSYSYRIFDPMFAGFPDATVGAVVGPLSRQLSASVPVQPTAASFKSLNGRLDPDRHLVTLGISCESCHFGCREHAREGGSVHFLPTSPLVRVAPRNHDKAPSDSRQDAATINGICAQCHSGNTRLFANGAAHANSSEAYDFRRGSCSSQLRCVSCHEPHTAGPAPGGPDQPKHLALCSTCHEAFRDPMRAAAHTGHPASAGVTCLDCHMPRYTLGLEEVVRTHRIAVPVEQAMVTRASANACNLCHLDRSLRWTTEALEHRWGKKLELPTEGSVAADVDRPLGEVWLRGSEQALRLVAGQAYARSSAGKSNLPELLNALDDSEPINRVFAQKAVERLRGRKLQPDEYRLTAAPQERRLQIDQLLQRVSTTAAPALPSRAR